MKQVTKNKYFNRKHLIAIATIAIVVLFPIAHLYFRNLTLVNPTEVLITALLFFALGLAIFGATWLLLGSSSKAAILTSISMLSIMLFRPIENRLTAFIPILYYWHIVYLLLSMLILVAIVLHLKVKNELAQTFVRVIAAIFGVLVLTNVIMATPKIITELSKEKVNQSMAIEPQSTISSGDNVYLLIFDEYGGYDGLLRYANFDNSSFYEELENMGFSVAPYSRSDTISTNIEIPNLLNLSQSLTNDNYRLAARTEILEHPRLLSLFKQNDYFVNVIDDQKFLAPSEDLVDQIFIAQDDLAKVETFQLVTIKRSVFYPFFTAKEHDRADEIDMLFDELGKAADIQDSHVLTVSYMMTPHKPWVFDQNGNQISISERENWRNPNIYIGQLQYTSSRILETVKKIIRKDPNAIIVILSDHGYRLPMHLEAFLDEEFDNRALEADYQRNILNAVYYQGKEFEIGDLSGLNTLIKVVNTHFSMSIPFVGAGD